MSSCVQNYYSIVAKANIIAVGFTFFEVGEIVDAKAILFNLAEEFDSVSARCVLRRASDNKRRLDFEDNIGLWGQLDEQKVVLPTYAVANLKRLPRIDPMEVDLCVIAAGMAKLSHEVEMLSSVKTSITDLAHQVKEVHDATVFKHDEEVDRKLAIYLSRQQMHSDPGVTDAPDDTNGDTPVVTAAGNSYAVCAAALSADDFIEVNKKKARTTKRPQAVQNVSKKIIAL